MTYAPEAGGRKTVRRPFFSMRHPFARWIARRSLRWFYREIHIVGAERIPASGPVLLVGNHPNDLPDVLFGLLATDRPTRYVATAAAATSIAVRWVYTGMRVIPVTRVKDARMLKQRGADMAAANRVAFSQVTDALAAGDIVGVFPEGGVYDGPGIGPIRSGVARLALDSCISGVVSDISIVPIGMQYEAGCQPGSDVLVHVGAPLSLGAWLASAPERPHRAFTVELRRLLESVSRTAITASEIVARDRLLAAAGAARYVANIESGARRVAPIVSGIPLDAGWPTLLAEPGVAEAVDNVCDAAAKAGGRPVSARDCARVMMAASQPAPGFPTALVLRAPFALVAALPHALPLRGIWWLAKRISPLPSDRAARAIVPGFYLMFAWYALLGALLAAGLAATGWSWLVMLPASLLFVRLLPRLGDFAVAWYHEWSGHRLAQRVARWPEHDRAAIRLSMRTLQQACASHIHGPEVSSPA